MPDEFDADVARAEVERLRAKQAQLTDQDIILALQDRIDSLEGEILRKGKPKPAVEEKPVAVPTALTQDQIRKADTLIRESRVEKMRGNKSKALTLLQEAAATAPSSPTVLEALGDDLAERKQYKNALEVYQNALALAKGNVGIEKKVALMALRTSGMGSIDDQLRSGMTDSMFLTNEDHVASLGTAKILNAFLPGLGNIVIGRTAAGVTLLACWIGCVAWVGVMSHNIDDIVRMILGKPSHPNLLVLVPLFGVIVIWFIGLASVGGGAGGARPKGPTVDRPRPPVDLPFE